ncbi:MAG TPA: hypothetical protein VK186_10430, partial [Candidatus Deferrimicrobium sp.]|nr:hypothetical protein [Candidatus Deferrimicrobium sp.]
EMALDNLTLGRARMMWAFAQTPGEPPPGERTARAFQAMTYLEQAVEGLREAGAQEFLARGLLARAECYRHMNHFALALDDLNEARDIAELGGMKLYLCDYHLEAGRLCAAQGNDAGAAEHSRAAGKLIAETGYGRRKEGRGRY